MKTYKVAVTWEVCGEIKIEAKDLQDACHKVEADNDIPLPESDYVDGSFRIDREMSKYLNEGLSNGQPNME